MCITLGITLIINTKLIVSFTHSIYIIHLLQTNPSRFINIKYTTAGQIFVLNKNNYYSMLNIDGKMYI